MFRLDNIYPGLDVEPPEYTETGLTGRLTLNNRRTRGRYNIAELQSKITQDFPFQVQFEWKCDKCGEIFSYSCRRYACSECHDIDICPSCFKLKSSPCVHSVSTFTQSN